MWQLTAKGGSGFYNWNSIALEVATVTGSGNIKALELGETMVVVRDSMNARNQAQIKVEVVPITHFSWVEDHIEVQQGRSTVVSLIAHDKQGRKFTNCSSVAVQYDIKDEGVISIDSRFSSSYLSVKHYVSVQKSLLHTKQLFDE